MRRTLATLAAASLLALSACSSSDGDGEGSAQDAGGDAVVSAEAPAARDEAQRGAADQLTAQAYDADDGSAAEAEPAAAEAITRSEIKTGNVALRSDDVDRALFDVRKVVDATGGEVAQATTESDDEGGALRSRLVVRVPVASFDDAMAGLEGAADKISSSTATKDVTTEVLDIDVRVEVQRRSIDRIALLLDRAESIRDIVSIEAQLSRRQADLASLEKQQAYLADQTAMSTITVSLERTPADAPPPAEEDEAGFLSGLDAGWGALKTFGVGLATFGGAVLPWTLVLLVLGIPGVPLVRRLRRRTTPTATT